MEDLTGCFDIISFVSLFKLTFSFSHLYRPRSGVVIVSVASVCLSVSLSVCMYISNTITFDSLDVESLFLGLQRFIFVYFI